MRKESGKMNMAEIHIVEEKFYLLLFVNQPLDILKINRIFYIGKVVKGIENTTEIVKNGKVVTTSYTKYVFGNKKHKHLQMSMKDKQSMEPLVVRLLQIGCPKLGPNLYSSQFRSLHKADLCSKT